MGGGMDIGRRKCRIKRLNTVPTLSVTFDHMNYMKDETKDIDCHVLKGQNPQNHMALVSRKNQLYSGTTPPASESYCKTLLLIVDSSGKGTIVPTVPCRLANCTSEVTPKKPKLESAATIDMDDSKFGSKKYQRAVNTTKKLKGTKAGSSSALEKSLLVIKEADLDVLNTSIRGEAPSHDLASEMLPPCNRDATDVAEVYQVSDLLSSSELAELEGAAELYLNPPDDPSKNPEFLVNPFYNGVKDKTLLKMQLLLYANGLLRFSQSPRCIPKKEDAINSISPHSYSVGKKILDMFTSPSIHNNRMKSESLTDKALCHAMVAILVACDYKIQLDWFAGALKSTKKSSNIKRHVMNLARVVGLQKTTAKGNYFTLKLPLPPIRTAKMPRKKKTN